MKFSFALTCLLSEFCLRSGSATEASVGLLDPDKQPKFINEVPNALDPSFIFDTSSGSIEIAVAPGVAMTGLVNPANTSEKLETPIWGYGTDDLGYTWPGRTFVVQKDNTLKVKWHNRLPIPEGYLLTGKDNTALGAASFTDRSVVDITYHWAYSIEGYTDYAIEEHGTPIVPHLHGGHTDDTSDGNPEYFFTPEFAIKGPQWSVEDYTYDNSQPMAGCLWYHDHALGITRLNVYAGMAGFYIVRDDQDTGLLDNPLNLPAFPYELPLVVQDRMFKEDGQLFYPAFNGDPFYADFITDEGATVDDDDPTALAEMFGDFMTVNGVIWPKADVEPRNYRLRLLNGCDSRVLVLELYAVELGQDGFTNATQVPFVVIGGDQGLASTPTTVKTLVSPPARRFDIIIDFKPFIGQRLIFKNIGGDEPFGGDIPGPQAFEHTDKVMAFDVTKELEESIEDKFDLSEQPTAVLADEKPDNTRRLGLFEGHDNLGRLQPLLGTIDPAVDMNGDPVCWPDTEAFRAIGLVGQMNGTMTWHSPTTENIKLGDVEEWEIWNLSPDAHPVHLHMVFFELVSRREIIFDSAAVEGEIEPEDLGAVKGDGTYYTDMPLIMHDGSLGEGYHVVNPTASDEIIDPDTLPEYVTNFPLDVITALPHQVTTIRAKFDKEGRFNWHCHILAHEDHEMMRLFHVGELPEDQLGAKSGLCAAAEAGDNESEASATFSWLAAGTSLVLLTILVPW